MTMSNDGIPKTSGIYGILNRETGQIYVGSAVCISKRFVAHRCALSNGRHHSFRMQKAWDSCNDVNVFEFFVIEFVTKEFLIQAEQFWIDFYESYDPSLGYNVAPTAGSSIGRPCSAETRAKISAGTLGKKATEAELARRKAAMNTPQMRTFFARMFRSDDVRSRISSAKMGSGRVLTPKIIREAITEYETGRWSIKALCARYGVGYGSMQTALKWEGPKFGDVKLDLGTATTGADAQSVANKIAVTLRAVTDEKAHEIRALYATGSFLQVDIAARFNLNKVVVNSIIKANKGYKHLGSPLPTKMYRGVARAS